MTTIHGAARKGAETRTYRAWKSMVARCTFPSATGYDRYGGRGVKVCRRWRESFALFLADMGEVPDGMSLDRYPDGHGNYEPGNCRWATRQEQNENRSSVRWFDIGGERITATQLAKRLGITKTSLYERLAKWPMEQALGLEPRPAQVRVPPKMTPEVRRKISEAAKRRCPTIRLEPST